MFQNIFQWKGTTSARLTPPTTTGYSWTMRYMEPAIESGQFEFTIKIHTCSATTPFMVGVCSKDHDEKGGSHFGKPHAWGWNAYSSSGLYYGTGNKHTGCAGFQTNDNITFKIDKGKKTIEFWKNDALVHRLDNQDFPEEIVIGASVYQTPVDIELIEFTDFENRFFGMFWDGKMMEETRERLEYVVSKCGNFEVPLKNKTLNLWKPFIFHSNIKNLEKIDRYDGLKDMSLDVDEFTILQFLLGYNVFADGGESNNKVVSKKKEDGSGSTVVTLESLLDYFRFFQSLGLKKEMLRILRILSTKPKDFKESFELFVSFAKEFESDGEIESWFTSEPKMLDPPFTFQSSLSLCLFNRMKYFDSQLTFDSPIMFLPYVNIIAYHLKKYKKLVPVDEHREISTMELKARRLKMLTKKGGGKKKSVFDDDGDDEPNINKMLSKLFKMRNQKTGSALSNLLVITSDGKEIPAHREVLIVRSNFFYKMLSFGGRETEEMEKEAKVRLVDLKYKEAMTIIRFCYTGHILCPDLETFIVCLDHAHKYFEEDFLVMKLLSEFSEMVSNLSSRRRILECFKQTGQLLQNNEELKEMVIEAILKNKKKTKSGLTKKIILDTLRKAEKQKFEDVITNENKKLKQKVKELEEKMEEMNKSFEEFKIKVEKKLKKLESKRKN